MTARQSRLDIIKAIIQMQEIGSQEELAQALSKVGVNMTQATLSRDLKLLKVVKGFSPKVVPSTCCQRIPTTDG